MWIPHSEVCSDKVEIATVPVTDGNIYKEHFLKYGF